MKSVPLLSDSCTSLLSFLVLESCLVRVYVFMHLLSASSFVVFFFLLSSSASSLSSRVHVDRRRGASS